jgi:hypothetical protein
MRIMYAGPLWPGSTSLQRLEALQRVAGVQAIGHDSGMRVGTHNAGIVSLWRRIRWRLGWPADSGQENTRLEQAVANARPDALIVDSSRVINRATISRLRQLGVRCLAYYSPDDIVAPHNLSHPLRRTLPYWDLVFTTKTFNVAELLDRGVRRAVLVGKAYDPVLHAPAAPGEVGGEFEHFDAVFVGTYERERAMSINALAAAGVRVVVYGAGAGNWAFKRLHPDVELRPSVYGDEYRQAWHTGKVALCFLRKINRDRITQRTMEIAAMGRPMVAERTMEHDAHFQDGREYFGFSSDAELVVQVAALLLDPRMRAEAASAIRARCMDSRYSTLDRAQDMVRTLGECMQHEERDDET